jgi:hypothetical protein
MSAPSLVETCRLLIQAVKAVARRALPDTDVQIALHSSIDYRQAAADNETDADPDTLKFPYIALVGPKLVPIPGMPDKIGLHEYRDKNLADMTITKRLAPTYRHLEFQIIVDGVNLANGDSSVLPIIQQFQAWAQNIPRIAGLLTEITQDLGVVGGEIRRRRRRRRDPRDGRAAPPRLEELLGRTRDGEAHPHVVDQDLRRPAAGSRVDARSIDGHDGSLLRLRCLGLAVRRVR